MMIVSIEVGEIRTEGDPGSDDPLAKQWTSAFGKVPVQGAVRLLTERIEGDQFGAPKYHGGVDKSALCYAASHYDHWRLELPDLTWGPGRMGENLTVSGMDESTVCIGDVYEVGGARVQVSQPRQPCWKIDRFHARAGILKRVVTTGRTGWYLRTLREGTLCAGDQFELIERPHPDWTITQTLNVFFGRDKTPGIKEQMRALPELSKSFG